MKLLQTFLQGWHPCSLNEYLLCLSYPYFVIFKGVCVCVGGGGSIADSIFAQ